MGNGQGTLLRAQAENGRHPADRLLLEEAADEMLREEAGGRKRVYTEKQLARKIRLESKRIPDAGECCLPAEALDYLLRKQISLMIDCSRLSKLQAAVLFMVSEGYSLTEIAKDFDISYDSVRRALRTARSRLSRNNSPYDGLYEVYWSEVHRYIYRKRTA
ncbi:MAG: sigma factor-like helix-turn-helix DNA-binding protein [Armatimonadota bacterium]